MIAMTSGLLLWWAASILRKCLLSITVGIPFARKLTLFYVTQVYVANLYQHLVTTKKREAMVRSGCVSQWWSWAYHELRSWSRGISSCRIDSTRETTEASDHLKEFHARLWTGWSEHAWIDENVAWMVVMKWLIVAMNLLLTLKVPLVTHSRLIPDTICSSSYFLFIPMKRNPYFKPRNGLSIQRVWLCTV